MNKWIPLMLASAAAFGGFFYLRKQKQKRIPMTPEEPRLVVVSAPYMNPIPKPMPRDPMVAGQPRDRGGPKPRFSVTS